MFLDETLDPEIPTDPNELALYRKYGKNWRNVAMGSTMRDRGGSFDRGMRFMHTTPEGFLQRPNMQSVQQVQQSNIDQSGFFAQMQQLQNEYNRALQEYYSLMGTTQYNQMQDYYQGNYEDLYGAGGGSQDSQYAAAVQETSADAPATDPTGSTAPTGSTSIAGPPPPKLIPFSPTYNNVQTKYQKDLEDGKIKASPARPDILPTSIQNFREAKPDILPTGVQNFISRPTLSDQFIPRYERTAAGFQGLSQPTATKPVTTTKKIKGR
jgi:hypothetical protein